MADRGYALVTGASSGIGVEIARRLAEEGYPLILVARRKERLEALRESLAAQVNVVVIDLDLSAENAAEALFERVAALGLVVEILVNNAGVGMQGRFLDMSLPRVAQMSRLNMTTLTELTSRFAADMVRAKRGYILQVASMAALLPSPQVAAYAATKAYVLSFSEALAFELRGSGVSVTTLYPGITTTEFNETAEAHSPALMNLSILSARKVADAGVTGMFRRRRAVVPGWINKLSAFFIGVLPRGMIVAITGRLMEGANAAA
jgi:uncharacterized protein